MTDDIYDVVMLEGCIEVLGLVCIILVVAVIIVYRRGKQR